MEKYQYLRYKSFKVIPITYVTIDNRGGIGIFLNYKFSYILALALLDH